MYGELKNELIILKGFFNFAESNLQLATSNNDNEQISIRLDDFEMMEEDYSTVLISYKIEFEQGDKGFVAINIPYSYKDISLMELFMYIKIN